MLAELQIMNNDPYNKYVFSSTRPIAIPSNINSIKKLLSAIFFNSIAQLK